MHENKNKPVILIVDDEPDIRHILRDILLDEGYSIHLAENASQAKKQFKEKQPHVVLLDIWMPEEDGISVLQHWKVKEYQALQHTPVIMISGHGTVENAVEAVKLGAYDFMEKPLSTAKLLISVKRALENASLLKENQQLKSRFKKLTSITNHSSASKELLRHIELLGPTDSWVFITGQAGTEKRLVAKKIHDYSPRASYDFHEINLSSLPTETIAAYLFGSESTTKITKGLLEKAQYATLCLTEVLDLSLATQQYLFNTLQEKKFVRVGGNQMIDLDIRIVATSSKDPETEVKEGRFREDLYYLLNVIPINVPSLAQRRKDIPSLIDFFLNEVSRKNQLEKPTLTPSAKSALQAHQWPGNIKQLHNVLQRLVILHQADIIDEQDVHLAIGKDINIDSNNNGIEIFFDTNIKEAKEQFEHAYLQHHFLHNKGNVAQLAKKIGIERTHLYRKLKQLNIEIKK